MIDIRVPGKAEGGIWSTAGYQGTKARAKASEVVAENAERYHGPALIAFVTNLVANQDTLEASVAGHIDKFVDHVCPEMGGVERRKAQKFGLMFAAGRFAIRAGILPWERRDCDQVMVRMYQRSREGKEDPETTQDDPAAAILQVTKDESAFPRFECGGDIEIGKACPGFVAGASDKRRLFMTTGALAELFPDNLASTLDELRRLKIALKGEGGKRTRQIRVCIAGHQKKVRFVVFKLKALKTAAGL
jgi:hypothetical protein